MNKAKPLLQQQPTPSVVIGNNVCTVLGRYGAVVQVSDNGSHALVRWKDGRLDWVHKDQLHTVTRRDAA